MIDTRRVIQLLMQDGHTAADVMVWISSRQEATLRDEFAGKALAAMIGQPDKDYENRGKNGVPRLAKFAYEYADAMIEAGKA